MPYLVTEIYLMQNDVSSETMVFIFQVNEIYDLRNLLLLNRNKHAAYFGTYAYKTYILEICTRLSKKWPNAISLQM